ncbi:cytochrome P450 2J4-like isoform X2 [Pelodiscus sinensis]|uniref:cytochrome P450 2J4-like isoform X2 n=1 Tax=Pelodiscus sinensis TaxID=13735 RepID=UPI003F6A5865
MPLLGKASNSKETEAMALNSVPVGCIPPSAGVDPGNHHELFVFIPLAVAALAIAVAGYRLNYGKKPKLKQDMVLQLTIVFFWSELAQIHGNIFTLWLGQSPVIVLHGFQAVKDGLTNNPEDVSGRPTTPFFNEKASDKGIILTSGHTWKQQRRFGLMTLRNLGMGKKGLEQLIQEEARYLVEYLTSERGQPLDPSVSFSQAFSNVICAVVLGHRFSTDDETLQQLLEANDCLLKSGGSLSERLYNTFPWLMDHLPGPHKKMVSSHEFMYRFAKEEIRCHRERGVPDEPQDFIDFYLAQMVKCRDDPTSTFDEDSLIHTILDLFIAGTESTATTLRWALISLVLHPDVQEKVQQELDVVLGSSQLICYEDRKNLPYTNAVIHEIQRYHCIAPVGVPRQCVKDTTLLGSPVPKGTVILPNICSVLADPEQWETPRQFNPAHFLDKEGNFMSRDAFLPFSAGHRVCLGERLARTELFIFFTNLLRAFTFSLPEGVTEINTERILGGLLQPHHYKICAIPR